MLSDVGAIVDNRFYRIVLEHPADSTILTTALVKFDDISKTNSCCIIDLDAHMIVYDADRNEFDWITNDIIEGFCLMIRRQPLKTFEDVLKDFH